MSIRSLAGIAAMLIVAAPVSGAFGHGGGLNSEGCHNETATGGYHCHRNRDDDDKDDVDWALIGGVAGGALVLWLLIDWLKDDKAETPSLIQIVPYAYDGDRSGIAAEHSLGRDGAVGLHTTIPTGEARDSTRFGAYWRLKF